MQFAAIGLLALTASCATVADAPTTPAAPLVVTPTVVTPAVVTPAVVTPAVVGRKQPVKAVREVPKPAPTLDVAGLTARLRGTSAIGVFTKLALKNQMDDLLQQVRAQHQGGGASGVKTLRQPYDMLVLKVLAVLQDDDPSLAQMISGSREAIWAILADPVKFNALA
ncbi:MAG TPA: hypothetical protein VFS80_15410 [Burkholderiales bacterium]|nr:hypothetical protein [Burkholderiales bacterium]